MNTCSSMPAKQSGNTENIKYIVLTLIVAIAVIAGIRWLWQGQSSDDTSQASQDELQDLAPAAEPIKTVNFQEARVPNSTLENKPRSAPASTSASDSSKPATQGRTAATNPGIDSASEDLFQRGERKLAFTDGLHKNSDATGNDRFKAPTMSVNAIDAFDFGVLDGRVRVGLFGKGPINDYSAAIRGQRYSVDMPGEFRYIEQFTRRLEIAAAGVNSAQLQKTSTGIRLTIEVGQGQQYKPFLIEDVRGLMVAFEPQ